MELFINRIRKSTFLVLLSCFLIPSNGEAQEYRHSNISFSYIHGIFNSSYRSGGSYGGGINYLYRMKPRLGLELGLNLNKSIIEDYEQDVPSYFNFRFGLKMTTRATRRFQGYVTPNFGLVKGKEFQRDYILGSSGYYYYTFDEEKFTSFGFGADVGFDLHIGQFMTWNLGVNYNSITGGRSILQVHTGFGFKF